MTSSTPNSPNPTEHTTANPTEEPTAGPDARVAGQGSGRTADLPPAGPDARVAELEDRLLRSAADLDNLRKRLAGELERERARATAEWLPVLDNLELALRHAKADPEAVVDGLRAVHEQALAVLSRLGYPRQDDEGAAFDPERHDAVATVPAISAPPGTVAEVVRPGYGEGGRRLRPAAVVVATKGD
ncbi:hypothetical protein Acor_14960 [Acrocarpospora corrugata]|uniref:Protein GrpE n=1 Tax=Acrocarpospora corrugata TaxID=35763 RepID=A0A5M3VWF6_9ACTN|nr:nucleotide exchange factor GrpE [Acrocarpospora corrugata]GER99432.1 hypothetical protein Acor_14960 [Acrocarpospora corrugata]